MCRELYPCKSFFSFRRGGVKSRIDRFYVTSNVRIESYDQEDFSVSDHDLIKVEFVYQGNSTRGKGLWRNKTKLYGEVDFKEKFSGFWESFLCENVSFSQGWWLKAKAKIKKIFVKF